MAETFGKKATFCAMEDGAGINTGDSLQSIIDIIGTSEDGAPFSVSLKVLLGVLIQIMGVVRKIRVTRLYRLVLRRFILVLVLVELLENVGDRLIDVLEHMVLAVDSLEELQQIVDCTNEETKRNG